MKNTILILLLLGGSNLGYGQKKSEKQVRFWMQKEEGKKGFHKNNSRDTCVIFWEEYNSIGKIVKKYDFPSDRCWSIDGPWEHHYIYDTYGRIIEHRDFGGEEGKERTLFRDFFYSYPHINEPYLANEIVIVYDFKAKTKIEEEKIDTIRLDTINTTGMYENYTESLKFDTVIFQQGYFAFKEDFKYEKKLFEPSLIEKLINKDSVEDFEIALIENIKELSFNLQEIHRSENIHTCEFSFREKDKRKELQIRTTESFINIEYKFINKRGDVCLSFHYEYYINGDKLKKENFVKSYIDYY